jgi:hypothetical protein
MCTHTHDNNNTKYFEVGLRPYHYILEDIQLKYLAKKRVDVNVWDEDE